jgi:outer membrane protein TolC
MKRRFWAAAVLVALAVAGNSFAAEINWSDAQSIVDAAVAANPTLARSEAEIAASNERWKAAASLPNPMVMTGVQDMQVDFTRDEMMTMFMIGASQTFTRGSKRTAVRRAGRAEVRGLELQTASLRAEVERDVRFAYYDVAAADEQMAMIEQVREAINAIVDAARVRYEIGNAAQAEVIRAQLERSNLERQLITVRAARAAAVARLLPLIGLPQETVVPTLELPEMSKELEIPRSTALPEDHPALQAALADIEFQDQQIASARLATKPDLTVEASYGLRPEQTDMFSLVARVELPFRRDARIEPRIREASALRDSARQRLEEVRRQLSRDLGVASAVHDEMNQQFRLLQEVLVPQARLAFESTLASYQTGKSTFDSILTAETTWLSLQLQYYQYLARHLQAVIDYEAIQRGARSGRIAVSAPDAQIGPVQSRGGSSPSMNTM